jgi:hypothetical protein
MKAGDINALLLTSCVLVSLLQFPDYSQHLLIVITAYLPHLKEVRFFLSAIQFTASQASLTRYSLKIESK